MPINRNFYRHSLSLLLFLSDQQHRQPAPLFSKQLPQIKLPEHDGQFLGKPGLGLSCQQALDLRPKRKNKKTAIASGLFKSLILMVPEAGIEPARRERRGILNA